MSFQYEQSQIRATLDTYHGAMIAARTDILDDVVLGSFTLGHITGYVQPKEEWLGVICSRQFSYHAIDLDDAALRLEAGKSTATLTGNGVFDATINGTTAPWRLKFDLKFSKHGDVWKIASATYTSY